jgi:hypothetical protein
MKWTCIKCGLQVDDKRVPNDCNGVNKQTHEWKDTQQYNKEQENLKWNDWKSTSDYLEWKSEYNKIKSKIKNDVKIIQDYYLKELERGKEKYNNIIFELNKTNKKGIGKDIVDDAINIWVNENEISDISYKWKEYWNEIDKKYIEEIEKIILNGKNLIQENNKKYGVKDRFLFEDSIYNYNNNDYSLLNYEFSKLLKEDFIADNEFRKEYNIGGYHDLGGKNGWDN